MGQKTYIGIDPGKTGAMAIIGEDVSPVLTDFAEREKVLKFFRLDSRDCLDWFSATAVVEKANAHPGQGVVSTFSFGTNYGIWLGQLELASVPYDIITPAAWKKEIFDGMKRSGDLKADSLDRARRLFPECGGKLRFKKDHNRAEALLLAEYCRRMHTGTLRKGK